MFNHGSGSANMSSDKVYNDNEWHTVLFSRQGTKGKLVINGDDEQFGESTGNTRAMTVQAPFSFGGVSPGALENMNLNLKLDSGKYFSGCLKNIQMGGHSLENPSVNVGVVPCSDQIEKGTFFGKGGGYVKVFINKFVYFLRHKIFKFLSFFGFS